MQTTEMKGLEQFSRFTMASGNIRRRRLKIVTPTIDTYSKQIRQCQRQYTNLHLDEPSYSVPSTPFPRLVRRERSFPMATRTLNERRPYLSINSQPSSDLVSSDLKKDNGNEKSVNMNPFKLISFLQIRGVGEPTLINAAFTSKSFQTPDRVKSRRRSKDPFIREKLKGQARLDYELANIRADAFCAQQRGMFRTASAGFRDRDAIFVEEEIRAQMQRVTSISSGSFSGGTGSRRHVDKKELFERIQTWMDEVQKARGLKLPDTDNPGS